MEPKTIRNSKIVRKRIESPKEWSFSKLAEEFRIKPETAHDIFKRDLSKYATAKEIARYKKVVRKTKVFSYEELSTVK